MDIHLFHHYLLKILFILHWIVWVPLSKNLLCICGCISALSLLLHWFVCSHWHHYFGIPWSLQQHFPSSSGWRTLCSHWAHRRPSISVPHSCSHAHRMGNVSNTWPWCGISQVECVLQLDNFSLFRYLKFGVIHFLSQQFKSRENAEKKYVWRHEWAQATEQPKTSKSKRMIS